ncbi:hypothetical protein BV22DRAFT_908784 [Leucogyrophana mollusca]|uniref:Uncharacterized protein n=1 Tax=Leucogyrophana mollusca TaxID=85980 RepID=A0ACB8AYH7_9AGAM|nr:hypothetical protein BV22DRAFT_908784 [Leucogyrophana mollusca]
MQWFETMSSVRNWHSRLVLCHIGHDLVSFASVKELITVVRDALEGYKFAYEQAGVHHRDISVGNIVFTTIGEGILLDWDTRQSPMNTDGSWHNKRTGTWIFMAAALLQKNPPCYSLADDLESIVHVLTWIALRYIRNSFSDDPGDLSDTMADVYCKYREVKGVFYGGQEKMDWLLRFTRNSGRPKVEFHDNPSLQWLIWQASALCATRYDVPQQGFEEPIAFEVRKTHHAAALAALGRSQALLNDFEKVFDGSWPGGDISKDSPKPETPPLSSKAHRRHQPA